MVDDLMKCVESRLSYNIALSVTDLDRFGVPLS